MSCYLSIITPTKDRSHKLNQNLENLLIQNFNNFEWIIIIEKEDQKTIEMINSFKKKYSFIKSIIGDFKSIEKAFNIGINKAEGKYILLKPDDDFLSEDALSTFYENSKEKKDYKWFIGLGEYYKSKRKIIIYIKKKLIKNYSFANLILINFIMTPSVYLSNSLLKKIGGLDEKFGHGSDYQLWLKIGSLHNPFVIDKVLSYATIDTTTQTGQFEPDKYFRILSELKKYNKNSLIIYFLQIFFTLCVVSFNFIRKIFYSIR